MKTIEKLNENLVDFFDRITSWETSVIQSGPLTISEAHAIEKIGHYGSMNMKDLSGKLGVTTGTTTITVDRLEKGGYAVRKRPENDRRSYIIVLTQKGQEAFLDHHNHHLNLAKEISSVLSEDEISNFSEILEKINENI
ncbi:MarR family transcriptional regulator [Methanoplanus sp. FWC-SCC4]|uniref:MarR family transcriptional regulator n=1 Tax=Methanochimaera problematica TaxID=2609417 RepID=A0AA97I355_9EURY|nr:MarR family transcriptional regulator [Methanoplanus sp. FWC-SCC4]WOF16995.1 MarR family transcriptional regulator [Methanoplanus sp. FWC-SCC4]